MSAFTDKVSGANYSGGAAVSDPIVNEEVPRGTAGSLEVSLKGEERRCVFSIERTIDMITSWNPSLLLVSSDPHTHRDIVGEGK